MLLLCIHFGVPFACGTPDVVVVAEKWSEVDRPDTKYECESDVDQHRRWGGIDSISRPLCLTPSEEPQNVDPKTTM